MPFARPTLSELRSGVAADIGAALPGADALLRFSNLRVLGDAQAALAHLHYGYLDWIARQAVPFTASGEFLEGWAGLKGVTRRPASPAIGTVTFTGAAGTVIPAGSELARGDGVLYTTDVEATIGGGGTVDVAITAALDSLDPKGSITNADAGTAFTLTGAIAGVQSGASAATALTGGADVEDDDSLRSRMLQVYAAPPQGGDATDYVEWAMQVAGVTRAWALRNGFGPGTVVVYAMFDQAEAAHGGFPQGSDGGASDETRLVPATGDQLAVANHIWDLQPVTAKVSVVSPVAHPVDFTITGLAGASADTKAAVQAAIAAVFLREGAPGGVSGLTPGGAPNGTVDLSFIDSAIIAIPLTLPFVVTAPVENVVMPTGHLPMLGTVTFA